MSTSPPSPGETATDVAEPRADDAPAPAPVPDTGGRVRRVRRRRGWIVLSVVLTLLLAGTTAGAAHLWQVSEAWIERDGEWRAHARGLAAELAETNVNLEDTVAELEVVRGQLDEAQARISELADEKARLGDEHAVVRQLAEYQERVSQAAGAVVTALDACIASQQQLIRWHRDVEEPDDEDFEAYAELAATVSDVCRSAQEAKDALQEELDG